MEGFQWEDGNVSGDIDRVMKLLGGQGSEPPELSHLDHEVRTLSFWQALTAEQLHYLRTMMLAIAESGANANAHAMYHIGVAEALLRFKYNLCPRCMTSHDSEETFEEAMSSKRHYRAACKQFNVIPEASDACDFTVGNVTCGDCGTVHDSLAARMVASGTLACPGCTRATAAKKT